MAKIRKQYKKVTELQGNLEIAAEKLKCDCNHHQNGVKEINLYKVNMPGVGPVYRCKECDKVVDIQKKDMETVREAFKVVDSVLDIIKLTADPEGEKDRRVIEECAKVQFFIRNRAEKLYSASVQKNNGGGKRKNKGNGQQDSAWNRPNVL